MVKEEWRDIAGFEGKYQVSNLGRIKSLNYLHTEKEKILSPGNNGNYLFVELCKNGIRKKFTVHRLVAMTFLENPDNLPMVNHKNEIKTDNSVDNLEFCTFQYNNTYNNKHIKIGRKLSKKVACYKDGKLIKVYESTQDVKLDGFHQSAVCRCCQGNRKSHHGFQWKYL